MLNKIKSTLKHTAVYGLGTIATKCIGIVLLPLYVKHITVSEYGIIGILEITIMILSQMINMGQSQAFLRFYNLEEYQKKRESIFFTIFIFLIITGSIFNIAGQIFSTQLASFFSKTTEFNFYFKLCFWIIFIRMINNYFLTELRANEKSVFYAIGNIIKIILILTFNIYFIAYLKIGLKGILFSYLIGDGILFLVLCPNMIVKMKPEFDYKIINRSFHFGFPLIFAGLTHMLLNMGNRYILKLLVDYKEVGLFNLGYKIAGILNVFLIQSFQLSLLPIAYKLYGEKGSTRFYTKMLTYFTFILVWAGLAFSVYCREIVEVFVRNSSDYWRAYTVIPYIVLAYIFSGAKMVINLGLYLKRKTNIIAYTTIGALILNIGLNFLLIPKYKMIGSAIASIISFFVLYIVTHYIANHYYPIPYENKKFSKLLSLAFFSFFIASFTTPLSILPRIGLKLLILILFPILLYYLNFYEPIEIERIKDIWKKIIKRKVNVL
jgi:O-antigen/teichoic acid export membrane protein